MKKRIFTIHLISFFLSIESLLFSMEKKPSQSKGFFSKKKAEENTEKEKNLAKSCPENRTLSRRSSIVLQNKEQFELRTKEIENEVKREREIKKSIERRKSIRVQKDKDPVEKPTLSPSFSPEKPKTSLTIPESRHIRKRSKTEPDLRGLISPPYPFVDDVEEVAIQDASVVNTHAAKNVTSLLGALSFAKKSEEEEIFSQEIEGKSPPKINENKFDTIKLVDKKNEKEKKLHDLFKQLEETQEEVQDLDKELRQRRKDKLRKQLEND